MPRPENQEPSAPPIHMMPGHNLGDPLRERSPPPRYEEAIAQDNPYQVIPDGLAPVWLPGLPPPPHQQHRQPSIPTSTRAPLAPVRRSQEEASLRRRPNSCNPGGSSPTGSSGADQNRPNSGRGDRGHRTSSARHRSTSPGAMSDGSYDRDSETGLHCEGARTHRGSGDGGNQLPKAKKKKRGSGSRIKKGLENIAFFIIQILD